MAKSSNRTDKAILARVEQIVDLLRTRYVREGWKMDEDGAARTLAYFWRYVEGPPFKDEDEDTTEFHEGVVKFVGSHGQSLDWILDGDPSSMICMLAALSNRSRGALSPPRHARAARR